MAGQTNSEAQEKKNQMSAKMLILKPNDQCVVLVENSRYKDLFIKVIAKLLWANGSQVNDRRELRVLLFKRLQLTRKKVSNIKSFMDQAMKTS